MLLKTPIYIAWDKLLNFLNDPVSSVWSANQFAKLKKGHRIRFGETLLVAYGLVIQNKTFWGTKGNKTWILGEKHKEKACMIGGRPNNPPIWCGRNFQSPNRSYGLNITLADKTNLPAQHKRYTFVPTNFPWRFSKELSAESRMFKLER